MKQIVSNEKWSIKYSWPYVYIFMLPTILSFMQFLRAFFFSSSKKKYQFTFVAVANKIATKKKNKSTLKDLAAILKIATSFFFYATIYFPSCSLPGSNNSKNVRFAFINLAAWGEELRKKANNKCNRNEWKMKKKHQVLKQLIMQKTVQRDGKGHVKRKSYLYLWIQTLIMRNSQ